MVQQLTLPIALPDAPTFDNFFLGPNAALVDYLQAFVNGEHEAYVCLTGESGAGRSHLLQACCHLSLARQQPAVYLSLAYSESLQPDVLEQLEQSYLVCLDDIHKVLGQPHWEAALFDLYHRLQDSETLLMISAPVVPQQLPIQLADLASRLASGVCLQLQALNDEQKIAALKMRAQHRGLLLPDAVGEFLLRRYPRDMTVLFSVLEKLDDASLRDRRKLTIPFIKQVLVV